MCMFDCIVFLFFKLKGVTQLHILGSPLYKWIWSFRQLLHIFIVFIDWESLISSFLGREKKERNQSLMDDKVQGQNGVSAETPIPLLRPYKLGKFQLSHRCQLHFLYWFSPIFFHIFHFHLLGVAGFFGILRFGVFISLWLSPWFSVYHM